MKIKPLPDKEFKKFIKDILKNIEFNPDNWTTILVGVNDIPELSSLLWSLDRKVAISKYSLGKPFNQEIKDKKIQNLIEQYIDTFQLRDAATIGGSVEQKAKKKMLECSGMLNNYTPEQIQEMRRYKLVRILKDEE